MSTSSLHQVMVQDMRLLPRSPQALWLVSTDIDLTLPRHPLPQPPQEQRQAQVF